MQANVIAMSGRAVEAAGDVDVLLLDKTGTITLGNRQAAAFIPAAGVSEEELADAAQLASLADETPEGRSIVVLAKQRFSLRERDLSKLGAEFVPFSAHTRMSGVNIGSRQVRKGAADAIQKHIEAQGGLFPRGILNTVQEIARRGSTPLLVSDGARVLGAIELKDIVKGGIKERFGELRKMGIKTIMITGDNPLTAAAIAAESGVDDFLAEATPEAKLQLIRAHQAEGRLVAMTGDGTNDAPALAQADVAVAMNTGTQAAKEAGNMVDLDSNPTKLIEVVETGKQMLMTRGSLTTFSVANDVAKYFAIIPAAFATTYPQLDALNVMRLATPFLGHSVCGHLQCADHRAVDPAGAEGRKIPAARRGGAAAAQPADLRSRRGHHPVPRDQGHRPGPRAHAPHLSAHHENLHSSGPRVAAAHDRDHRHRLSAARHGAGPGALPGTGTRQSGPHGRQGPVGSRLIGQNFTDPKHFWGRPSATTPQPYNGLGSTGSNLGPLNPALVEAVQARIEALKAADPGNTAPVPVDLVTASGSGLDPEISIAAAHYQAPRVARARGLSVGAVEALIVPAPAGGSWAYWESRA